MQCIGKYSKKFLFAFLCILTMLPTACGSNAGFSDSTVNPPLPTPQGAPLAPSDKQIYHSAIVGSQLDISTFDPAIVTDLTSENAISMVFNGLIRIDDNLQVQNELAQSVEQSSDHLQWTFHLRPNLKFSDGNPLTSQDVAYSIDRALQPTLQAAGSPCSYYLRLIKDSDKLSAGKIKTIIGDSILTPDASTVVLLTSQKAAYFLQTLTYPCSYVVEKKLIDKYADKSVKSGTNFTEHLTEGGGSGPFKVSLYTHKQEIDFVPNSYYYSFKPILQKVIFPFIQSPTTALQKYQNGELDTTTVSRLLVDEARQLGGEYKQTPQLEIDFIAMNFLAKPFDNLSIRQAFALSIKRETLRYDIYKDTVIPSYHIIPQGMADYNDINFVGPAGVKDTQGSPSVAQARLQQGLQEEGWSNIAQMPSIKLTYAQGATSDRLVSKLIQMWQSVLGVIVTPDPVDRSTLSQREQATTNNPQGLQMWYDGWIADYPDSEDWTTLQFGTGAPFNYMNYGQNKTADALQEQQIQAQLQQADAELDPKVRTALYQSAEHQLINQVAWVPLYQPLSLNLLKPYVQGLTFNILGIIPPTDWANIYIAQH